jgi:hypothetical protein
MGEFADVGSTTLTHRIALVGVVELGGQDDIPTHAGEITRCCIDRVDAAEIDILGKVLEADMVRARNEPRESYGALPSTQFSHPPPTPHP